MSYVLQLNKRKQVVAADLSAEGLERYSKSTGLTTQSANKFAATLQKWLHI